MAIFHLSAKIISRKTGRSSTGAAAYRAGERIVDERTGVIHDYTKKGGIAHSEIVMPAGAEWQPTRAELWNAVEAKNKRADAQVAREFEFALPAELAPAQQRAAAQEFAQLIADRYQIGVDMAVHDKGDGNPHCHALTTTNRVEGIGLGNKARELDAVAHDRGGKIGQPTEIEALRSEWARVCNLHLARAGLDERVDHRSHADRGIEQAPTKHMGPVVSDMIRKGKNSDVAERIGEQHVDRDPAPAPEQIHAAEIEADALRELRGAVDSFRAEWAEAKREIEEQERQREAAERAERSRSFGYDR